MVKVDSFVIPLFGSATESGSSAKGQIYTSGYLTVTGLEGSKYLNISIGQLQLFEETNLNAKTLVFRLDLTGTYTIKSGDAKSSKAIYSKNIEVTSLDSNYTVDMVRIVSWANGSEELVINMIDRANAGELNLGDYWTVGQERTIHVDAVSHNGVEFELGGTSVRYTYRIDEQDVKLVLLNKGGFNDDYGKEVNYIIGAKKLDASLPSEPILFNHAFFYDDTSRKKYAAFYSRLRTFDDGLKAVRPSYRLILGGTPRRYITVRRRHQEGDTETFNIQYYEDVQKGYGSMPQAEYYKTASNRNPATDKSYYFLLSSQDGSHKHLEYDTTELGDKISYEDNRTNAVYCEVPVLCI